jgi:uncharacterized protein (TIGR03790 family)
MPSTGDTTPRRWNVWCAVPCRLPCQALRLTLRGRAYALRMSSLLRPTRTRAHASLALLGMALLLAACGGGGGSAGNTGPGTPVTALAAADLAVLIAEGDATSEAIGLAYQQARGIPEAQMIRVAVPRGSDTISASAFAAWKAALDARLPAAVQATLVTWTQPSRVVGSCAMSITSALAFGYDAAYCATACSPTRASGYFDSPSSKPWTDLRVRPSMMLGASTLAQAQAIIARGVGADASWTGGKGSGQAVLLRTTDGARSVRYGDFQLLAGTSYPRLTMRYIDNSSGTALDYVSGQTGLMFYFTGLVTVPQIASNSYLPGAVADHFTSLGGHLPDGLGQMPATQWLQAGATASYGTVEEPCNYTEKFPQASVLVRRYQRGETLIEAYWKSVQWPGQGLFLGEPLARPWGP